MLVLNQESINPTVINISHFGKINIDTYHLKFEPWKNKITFDTYCGKTILNFERKPLFAELLVLRLLEKQGYKGIWIDNFRKKYWIEMPKDSSPVSPDKHLELILDKVKTKNKGQQNGCWDILAYKGKHCIFAELKLKKKDRIRKSQLDWLSAGLSAGLNKNNFLFVEWELV